MVTDNNENNETKIKVFGRNLHMHFNSVSFFVCTSPVNKPYRIKINILFVIMQWS